MLVSRHFAVVFLELGTSNTSSGVIIFASGGLGDAVLLAHVLPRFVSLAQPGEPVSLVLRHDAARMEFLFRGLATVEVVDYDRFRHSFLYRRATVKRLNAIRWRLVIDTDYLRHPKRDEKLVKRIRADRKVAMEPRAWTKYDRALRKNRATYDRLYDSGPAHLDKVVRWSNFANWLAGTAAPLPVARLPDERLPPPAPAVRPFVVLVPFSAVPDKQALPDLFVDLVRRLPSELDIVVVGAPDDPAKNPEYAPLFALPRVTFDASDFERLAPRLRAARLVISVDTAAMHLAVAVGGPTPCLASAPPPN